VIKGSSGEKGGDGLTPNIGKNGNWWIGDIDTGVNASGKKGAAGDSESGGSSYTKNGFSAVTKMDSLNFKTSDPITINDFDVSGDQYYTSSTTDPSVSLDTSTGVATVNKSGRYHVSASLNYTTTEFIDLGSDSPPSFQLVSGSDVLAGTLFDAIHIDYSLYGVEIDITPLIGNSNVQINTDLYLKKNTKLKLQVSFGGNIAITLDLSGSSGIPGTWSMRQLTQDV
jgi:hypothetical protein